MGLPLTFGVLAALTGVLVLVRIFWEHVPHRMQLFLVACAFLVPIVFGIAHATRWSTSSNRMNYGIYWLCIASYEFLLLLFTRLRPKWLTSIIAIVLILPILSASAFIPLALFFESQPATRVRIGDQIVSERVPWGSGTAETSGTDLTVYYQPDWMPLLRRQLVGGRLFGGQCNAWAAYAVILPDRKRVELICPASPDLPDSAESIVWPLHRPLFFNPHPEVIPSSK